MYERLTDRSKKVMSLANQVAQRMHHEYIGTEHILLGIVEEGRGVGANLLKEAGIDTDAVYAEIEKRVEPGDDSKRIVKLPMSAEAKKVIELAIEEARTMHHHFVGTEHLMLGLLAESNGTAAEVLTHFGLTLKHVEQKVKNMLNTGPEGGAGSPEAMAPRLTEADPGLLETFSNPHLERDYAIEHNVTEFTSLCPKTGQPDFGQIQIRYIADKVCIELKSLKFYMQSYRNSGIFYEDVTNTILNDLVSACHPRWMQVRSEWTGRGGIFSVITAEHGDADLDPGMGEHSH